MKYTMIAIACLGLLQMLLAINVSINRIQGRVSSGTPDDVEHPLHRAIVAHRNACEFGPILCVLLLALQLGPSPYWSIYLGPVTVLLRTAHAIGLTQFSLRRPNMLRRLGAGGTYVLSLVLVGTLFYTLF